MSSSRAGSTPVPVLGVYNTAQNSSAAQPSGPADRFCGGLSGRWKFKFSTYPSKRELCTAPPCDLGVRKQAGAHRGDASGVEAMASPRSEKRSEGQLRFKVVRVAAVLLLLSVRCEGLSFPLRPPVHLRRTGHRVASRGWIGRRNAAGERDWVLLGGVACRFGLYGPSPCPLRPSISVTVPQHACVCSDR